MRAPSQRRPRPGHARHAQLTALQELAGFVYEPQPSHRDEWAEGGDREDAHNGWEGALPSVAAGRLLPRLPRLRRLALYTYKDHATAVRPWVAGSLRGLAPQAALTLEELALSLQGAAASAQPAAPLPHVTALHLSACDASAYPKSLARAFPNCRRAIFGDTVGIRTKASPPAQAVAAMAPLLESLALGGANVPLLVPALAACTALAELQLSSSEWLDRAPLLAALRALPRLEFLDLWLPVDPPFMSCPRRGYRMDPDLVAALSGGGRPPLTATVGYPQRLNSSDPNYYYVGMWQQPSLVPVDEYTYHPHYAR